jgi:hypothetical protein
MVDVLNPTNSATSLVVSIRFSNGLSMYLWPPLCLWGKQGFTDDPEDERSNALGLCVQLAMTDTTDGDQVGVIVRALDEPWPNVVQG